MPITHCPSCETPLRIKPGEGVEAITPERRDELVAENHLPLGGIKRWCNKEKCQRHKAKTQVKDAL